MKKTLSILTAVLILALSSIPVFAVPSPTASKEYKIIVHKNKGGSGTYTTKISKDGKHATITAHPKKGYKFDHWTIKGKYKITSGSLNDKTFKILLQSDVEVTPHFVKIGKKSSTPKKPSSGKKTYSGTATPDSVPSRNYSSTSPKTGDNTMHFAIAVSAVALIALSALGIKLAVSKK